MQSTLRVVSRPLREHTARLRWWREAGLAVVVVPVELDDPFLSSLFLFDDEEGLDRDLEDFGRVSERSSVGASSSAEVQRKREAPRSISLLSDFDERRATAVEQRTCSSRDDTTMNDIHSIAVTSSTPSQKLRYTSPTVIEHTIRQGSFLKRRSVGNKQWEFQH